MSLEGSKWAMHVYQIFGLKKRGKLSEAQTVVSNTSSSVYRNEKPLFFIDKITIFGLEK